MLPGLEFLQSVQLVDANQVAAAAPYGALVDAIERVYAEGLVVPPRQRFPVHEGLDLLAMPGWHDSSYVGVKIVTVRAGPPSGKSGLPAIQGQYLWFDASTGAPLAVMDGAELTARRTAATAALATRYLARPDSTQHLVIGTGNLASYVAKACLSIRPVTHTLVWGRRAGRAKSVVQALRRLGVSASAGEDLDALVAQADIISCVTSATDPVLYGNRLTPGTHVNLIGSYRPEMRECDDRAVSRARLFVDHRDEAINQSGDLAAPISRGLIAPTAIEAELAELAEEGESIARARTDITLFKSVGNAAQDFAAGALIWEHLSK